MEKLSFRKSPLHAQVREKLRLLIQEQFRPGDKFHSEPELIRRLGVSQGTVRRALSDLSLEGLLVRRVPQGTFVAENSKDTLTLGVFMPQYDSPFLMEMLENISRECRKRSVGIRIHQTYRGEELTEALGEFDPVPGRDRILLLGETPDTAMALYRTLSRRGHRVINFDTLLQDGEEPYVGVDNATGIKIGVDYLLKLGHRSITLLVNECKDSGNIRERVGYFESYYRKLGLSEVRIVDCGTDFWGDSADAASMHMDRVMQSGSPPTAILTVSAPGAWGALKWLQRHGFDVPSEVSLLSFDDTAPNRYMHPALTSISQPHADMARKILELVCAPKLPVHPRFLLPPNLVVRESCAAPRAAR